MTTQRTFEPHEFEPYTEAGNICRHCDRGKYAVHHQTTEHDDDNAPAAPKRGDRNAEQVRALAANWNQKSRLEQIIARHQMYDLSGLPNREYTASWEDVKLLIEQHSTLITQRERLLRLLRPVTSPTACYCAVMKSEKCWHCEARELITTIEQDQITSRTTSEQEGRTQ